MQMNMPFAHPAPSSSVPVALLQTGYCNLSWEERPPDEGAEATDSEEDGDTPSPEPDPGETDKDSRETQAKPS
jgi:hypothetical protein